MSKTPKLTRENKTSFGAGTVVLVTFPFSNLKVKKLRPALVLAQVEFDNLILCQITSKPYSSKMAIPIKPSDFSSGNLPLESFVRPDKLFTADPSIVKNSIGELNLSTKKMILEKVSGLFSG